MIVVKLQGGLGNQLFQYAFVRAVAARLKTEFRMDPYAFHTYYKLHKYSLDHFNIREQFTKDSDLFGFVWLRKHEKSFSFIFRRIFKRQSSRIPFYRYLWESTPRFDPSVFNRNNTYFDGYWNTEKYFADIAEDLRDEFTLKEPLSSYSQSISDQIRNTNAICLHVRRADYIENKKTEAMFGTCSLEYYQAAIAHIVKYVSTPHFYIFSDDHDWAKTNFSNLPYPVTCITNDAEKNYEDLTLMSQCKHNIIANSTFSWWGAWLNRNPSKIIIAPKTWLRNPKIDTSDVVPVSWIRL